jgi:tRNA uridine 5-carboxymethylaminomethyl modification enzyme
LPEDVIEQVEIEIKYSGYIKQQQLQIAQVTRMENQRLPEDIDYQTITGLSNETKEKLSFLRPFFLGQASRISGIRPADITILMLWLKKKYNSPGIQ